MTTESKAKAPRPTDSWTIEEQRTECARNRSCWDARGPELLERFPNHFIVVYGGGTAVAYADGEDLIEHLNTLDDFTRGAMHWAWPPMRNSRISISEPRPVAQ